MFPSRLALAKATEDAGASAGGVCPTFQAKLKLFAPAAVGTASVQLSEITGQTFEVTNASTKGITEGQEIIVGQTVDERWIVFPTSEAHPRIQFVTTQKITNRQVQAKVLRTHHNAPDLVNGGILEPGDIVTLNDPFNLWSDIESGATGWAYLAHAQDDDPSTSEDEEHVARYEIEECSLPTNEIKGFVRQCLFQNTDSMEVVVNFDDTELSSVGTLRSSYPSVDEIPASEIQDASPSEGTPYKYIVATNPNNLDAVQGTLVTLRRITDRTFSDPENYLCPRSRSSIGEEWEIVQVEKKFARIIKVKFQDGEDGGWIYDNFRADGYHPSDGVTTDPFEECDLNIVGPSNWVCDPINDTIGWAVYKGENSPEYQVVHTEKDLMGDPPEEVTFVSNAWISGCDLAVAQEKAKVFCKGDITIERSSIHPEEKVVLTAGALSITNECGSCSAVVIAKVRNIALVWDGANWVLAAGETCDGSYTAPNNPGPDDPHLAVVPCTTKEWKTTASCGSTSEGTCVCDTSSMPDASTQAIGATWTGTCTGPGGTPVMQLCWTYETETIYTLPCPGSPVTGGDRSCIPLTDCPEEEESGGGGTP